MQSVTEAASAITDAVPDQNLTGTVKQAVSQDGTRIAFSKTGQGPALILVDGALCRRSFGPMTPLAALLAPHFTVFTYDRRGRDESSDTTPYAVEREVEDIEALVQHAGGSAYVFGISSGAALALEAANRRVGIEKLALFEAPFVVDNTRSPIPEDYLTRLNALLAEDRRGDAVKLFMKLVGVPGFMLVLMPLMPAWRKLKAVAHTLPYDITIVKDQQQGKPLPTDKWTSVVVPTLVMEGGKSPVWIRNAMKELADTLPNAQHRTLAGQTHMVKPEVLAPQLVEFFGA